MLSKTFEDTGTSARPEQFCARSRRPAEAAHDVWQSGWMGDRYLKPKPFAAGRIRRTRTEKDMRIVCIGGGPAGLYFGLLMKKLHPEHDSHGGRAQQALRHVRLGRRLLRRDDGGDARLGPRDARPRSQTRSTIGTTSSSSSRAARMRTTGHGFVGIGRKQLLNILQARCEELGVELVFEREVDSDLEFPDADLIVASDGVNSKIRHRYADSFRPDIVVRPNRYIWLGTDKAFDAFTFDFRKHRARLVPGPHLQVRRRHLDLHRRDDRGGVRGARPRRARPGRARSPSARSCSPRRSTARS